MSTLRTRASWGLLASCLGLLLASTGDADGFVFTEDFCLVGAYSHGTPFPDGQGWVTEILGGPGIDADGNVAVSLMGMRGPTGMETPFNGIFVGDHAVVGWNDDNPSTGTKFSGTLSFPALVGGQVYFFTNDGVAQMSGNYRAPAAGGGPVSVVVDNDSVIPPTFPANTFGAFSSAGVSSAGAVFSGSDNITQGSGSVYFRDANGGDIVRVVSPDTLVPGSMGATFGDLSAVQPTASADEVAFVHHSSAVYTSPLPNGSVAARKIADLTTPIPDGEGAFTSFPITTVDIDAGDVVFTAMGSGVQRGLYGMIDGQLRKIVDTNTQIPGGSGNFDYTAYRLPVGLISARRVVFVGYDSNLTLGLYLWDGGTITKLLATGDTLGAETVSLQGLSSADSFTGDRLAFVANLTDPNDPMPEVRRCILKTVIPGTSPTTTTTTTITTTTTLGGAGGCSDANEDGKITATDALAALRTAVGTSTCAPCRCDTDDSGAINASDALRILRKAVGQQVTFTCPPC